MVKIWERITERWNAHSLTFYLKSGDRIVIDRVTKYTIQNRGNEIVGVEIAQWCPRYKLLIKTIDLSQIVAVVRS